MIQQNTPTNELIEVILEKSHKFTVGFPFNTRVKTLNHQVWFQCDSGWFSMISVWFRVIQVDFSLIQVDFSLIQADSGWFRLISRLECDFIEGKTGITLQCDFTEGKTGITLTTVWFHRRQIWNHTESTEINWNQTEIKWNHTEIKWNHTDSAQTHVWWFRVNHCIMHRKLLAFNPSNIFHILDSWALCFPWRLTRWLPRKFTPLTQNFIKFQGKCQKAWKKGNL